VTVIGEAFVKVKADTKGFADDAKQGVQQQGASLGKLFGLAFSGAAVFKLGTDAFKEAQEARKVAAQTAAAIKSTGGAANITSPQIGKLADQLSKLTGQDDEAIQSAENLLLTFTNVKNEVGSGNDIFNQATKTLLDMGTALHTDASGGAIQLGKALNDPVKGITALTRVGVTFTAQQKDQIKAFVAAGDTLSAQKIILQELNKEFGGSAEAAATAEDKFSTTFKNIEEQLGTALLPVIDDVANGLSVVLPGAIDVATKFLGGLAGAVSPVTGLFQHLFDLAFDPSKGAFGKTRWELGIGVIESRINDFLLGKNTNAAATGATVAKAFGIPEVPVQGPAAPAQGGLLGVTLADVQHDQTILALADANASTFDKVVGKTAQTISDFFGLGITIHPSDLHLGEGFDVIKTNFLTGAIEVSNFLRDHGGEELGKAVEAVGGQIVEKVPIIARDIGGAIQAVGRFLGDSPGELGGHLVDAGSKLGFLILDGIASGAQAAVGGVVTRVSGAILGAINLVGTIIDAAIALPGRLVKVGESIVNGIVNGIIGAGAAIGKAILSFIPSPGDVVKAFAGGAVGLGKKALGFAGSFFGAEGGTVTSGGLLIVGERGPEAVRLPTGSQIVPNNQLGSITPGSVQVPATAGVAAATSSSGSTFHVENMIVPAPPDASPLEVASTISEHFAWRFGASAVPA